MKIVEVEGVRTYAWELDETQARTEFEKAVLLCADETLRPLMKAVLDAASDAMQGRQEWWRRIREKISELDPDFTGSEIHYDWLNQRFTPEKTRS